MTKEEFKRLWADFTGCQGSYFANPIKYHDTLVKELDSIIASPPYMRRTHCAHGITIRDRKETLAEIDRKDLEQIVIQMLLMMRKASLMSRPEEVIEVRDEAIQFLYE